MMSIRDNRLGRVQQLCDQAALYLQQQQYHRAIADYLLALEIVEEWGTPQMAAALLHCVGSIYRQLEHYPRALAYYRRAVTLLPETDEELRPLAVRHINQVLRQQKENRHPIPLISQQWLEGAESLTLCF